MSDTRETHKKYTPEELAEIMKSLCMEDDLIPLNCSGKVNKPDEPMMFNYRMHRRYLDKKIEMQKYLCFKKVLSSEKQLSLKDFEDSDLILAEIIEHYGCMDSNSPVYKTRFEGFKKLRLEDISKWIKNATELKTRLPRNNLSVLDLVNETIEKIGKMLEKLREVNPLFHSESSFKSGNDFYKLPRPNISRESKEEETPELSKLLQKSEANTPGCSSEIEKLFLKNVIKEYPLGVCVTKFRSRIKKVGKRGNYAENFLRDATNESDLIAKCKILADVFTIPEKDCDMDATLLFPSYWTGLLTIRDILLNLWHWTKFLVHNVNKKKHWMFVEDIFPQMNDTFGVNFNHKNWNFKSDHSFIAFLTEKVSSEGNYAVFYDSKENKFKLFCLNEKNESFVQSKLENKQFTLFKIEN